MPLFSRQRSALQQGPPFKLYCDEVALLRSYLLSVDDCFINSLPPVLVSGNIPVRNSQLLMTLLNVIHSFPVSSPVYFDRCYSIFVKQKHPLYNCKVISLQRDATTANLKILSFPLALSPLGRRGKHRKVYNLPSIYDIYLSNLLVKLSRSFRNCHIITQFTAALLKDFYQFVSECAMGCFFSCSFIVADTPNLSLQARLEGTSRIIWSNFSWQKHRPDLTAGLNFSHHLKRLKLMRNWWKKGERA